MGSQVRRLDHAPSWSSRSPDWSLQIDPCTRKHQSYRSIKTTHSNRRQASDSDRPHGSAWSHKALKHSAPVLLLHAEVRAPRALSILEIRTSVNRAAHCRFSQRIALKGMSAVKLNPRAATSHLTNETVVTQPRVMNALEQRISSSEFGDTSRGRLIR
jgi:hypothetical protein